MSDSHPDDAASNDARELARKVGETMFAADTATKTLGIQLEDIGPGHARLSMKVRRDMLNGLLTCHGGMMFTLADSAFAFACNSRNDATVAAGCSIEFLRAVREGETLIATAQERVLSGRSGVYDITVTDSAGEAVAVFRGRSARVKGSVLPEA